MRTLAQCISIEQALEQGITRLRNLHWPESLQAYVLVSKNGTWMCTPGEIAGEWNSTQFNINPREPLWVPAP